MRQYLDAKQQHRDAIMFFRMGDFYEMFYEDALVAARALELTLHGRDWPFVLDRDALLLLLQEQGQDTPFATAWAQMGAQQIALELGWLAVRCGAMVPESDEVAQ